MTRKQKRTLRRKIAHASLLAALIINIDVLSSADPLHPAELNAYDTVITRIETKPYVKPETPEDYIKEVFGKDANDAFKILSCENKTLDSKATNHNRNGSIDRGIFQINSVHGGDELYDWRVNIDKAYQIFQNRGWTAWACSDVLGITPFWRI